MVAREPKAQQTLLCNMPYHVGLARQAEEEEHRYADVYTHYIICDEVCYI